MKLIYTAMIFSTLVVFSIVDVAYSKPKITVPIRFHIVSGLSMNKNGLVMESWVTAADIENTILPEVNRIWRAAEI